MWRQSGGKGKRGIKVWMRWQLVNDSIVGDGEEGLAGRGAAGPV
jgi:hypothetical protein